VAAIVESLQGVAPSESGSEDQGMGSPPPVAEADPASEQRGAPGEPNTPAESVTTPSGRIADPPPPPPTADQMPLTAPPPIPADEPPPPPPPTVQSSAAVEPPPPPPPPPPAIQIDAAVEPPPPPPTVQTDTAVEPEPKPRGDFASSSAMVKDILSAGPGMESKEKSLEEQGSDQNSEGSDQVAGTPMTADFFTSAKTKRRRWRLK
jgi:hypothetical protein